MASNRSAELRGLRAELRPVLVADGKILDRDIVGISLPFDAEGDPQVRPGERAPEFVGPELVDGERAVAGDLDLDPDVGEMIALVGAAAAAPANPNATANSRTARAIRFMAVSCFPAKIAQRRGVDKPPDFEYFSGTDTICAARERTEDMSVKFRLGAMMFLQYAIWGAWAPVLSAYLQNNLGFSGVQLGIIFSLLPLATIISPFIGGQFADRYFPTQRVIAVLQLVGGIILILIANITNFTAMMWVMLLYCLIYAPTLALTNSIAFVNLKNSEKEFGAIRVWGTIGWIAAGWLLDRLARAGQVARGDRHEGRHAPPGRDLLPDHGRPLLRPAPHAAEQGRDQALGLPRSPEDVQGQAVRHLRRDLLRRRHGAPVLLRPDLALPHLVRDRRQPEVRLGRHDHRPGRRDLRHGLHAVLGDQEVRDRAGP